MTPKQRKLARHALGLPNPAGFTDQIEAICERRCADDAGEPPCWQLPELVDPCEHITPCAECLADAAKSDNG